MTTEDKTHDFLWDTEHSETCALCGNGLGDDIHHSVMRHPDCIVMDWNRRNALNRARGRSGEAMKTKQKMTRLEKAIRRYEAARTENGKPFYLHFVVRAADALSRAATAHLRLGKK